MTALWRKKIMLLSLKSSCRFLSVIYVVMETLGLCSKVASTPVMLQCSKEGSRPFLTSDGGSQWTLLVKGSSTWGFQRKDHPWAQRAAGSLERYVPPSRGRGSLPTREDRVRRGALWCTPVCTQHASLGSFGAKGRKGILWGMPTCPAFRSLFYLPKSNKQRTPCMMVFWNEESTL